MKKKNNLIIMIGSIMIILLMISSATAVNVVNENSKEKLETKDSIYVDPKIKLTYSHLKLLEKSFNRVEDKKDKEFLAQIINTIKQKGEVRSDKIKILAEENNIDAEAIYSGFIISKDSDGLISRCFPGALINNLFFYIGPVAWLFWKCGDWTDKYTINVKINGIHHYKNPHEGKMFGYIGYVKNSWYMNPTIDNAINLFGYGAIIIID